MLRLQAQPHACPHCPHFITNRHGAQMNNGHVALANRDVIRLGLCTDGGLAGKGLVCQLQPLLPSQGIHYNLTFHLNLVYFYLEIQPCPNSSILNLLLRPLHVNSKMGVCYRPAPWLPLHTPHASFVANSSQSSQVRWQQHNLRLAILRKVDKVAT